VKLKKNTLHVIKSILFYTVDKNRLNKRSCGKKKAIFFFVEDMDLFVTLDVATFKNSIVNSFL
jgi:hypothetical protein